MLLIHHQFYCSIQAPLSGHSLSLVKSRNKLHLLASSGRSPNTVVTTRWAPAEGRCCEFSAAWSIELHAAALYPICLWFSFSVPEVRSTRAEDHVHNQTQSHTMKLMTSSQSSVAVTAFLQGGKVELYCASRDGRSGRCKGKWRLNYYDKTKANYKTTKWWFSLTIRLRLSQLKVQIERILVQNIHSGLNINTPCKLHG